MIKTPPIEKGVPKKLKDWLNSLREDVQTVEAVQGENVRIDNQDQGQVINVESDTGT